MPRRGGRTPTTRGGLLSDLLDSASRLAPADVLDGAVATVAEQLGAARAAIWTLDPRDATLTVAACAGEPLDPGWATVALGQQLVGRVARGRSPLHEAPGPGEPERLAVTAFPLMVRGAVVGVLAVWCEGRIGELESTLLGRVAEATATAAERREAQRQTTEVVASLNEIGRSLVAELDLDRLLELVVDAGVRLTGAEAGAVVCREVGEGGEGGEPILVRSRTGEAGAVERVALEGDAPVPGAPEERLPAGDRLGSRLGVDVVGRDGELAGALFVGHPAPGRFTDTDERLLEGIAGYAAIGIENARRFAAEQQIALTLQRALLPVVDPAPPGAEIAVRYLPASAQAEVGGDWYDTVALPDGTLAVTVGDVEGHSIEAAARMGTVRAAVGVFARLAADPAEVLRQVDVHLRDSEPSGMVTAVHATFDPATGRLRYARAGHPPPLLLRAGGAAELLTDGRGPLLGFGLYRSDGPAEVALAPGDTVVLFTDGLVERPGSSIDDDLEALRAGVEGCRLASGDAVCDRLLAAAMDDHPGRDDVVVLALRMAERT
jgi:GAF domain-containing protein